MPKRIPVQTIVMHRDGKRVIPPIGQAFDFTVDELEQIIKTNPKAVRKLINEAAPPVVDGQVVEEVGAADDTKAEKPAKGVKADKKESAKKDDEI